ncbi:MAG: hypothetical protein ACOVSW_01950 [Candidatus Kapaibacteriota bacterium]|jgi:hypothetical protein
MRAPFANSSFRYFASVLMMLWGVFLMIGGLVNMFPDNAPPKITPSDVFMFIALGIAPCVLGITLWLRTSKQRKERLHTELEQDILRLAKSCHNKLTASDVAIKIVLSPPQAEEALQEMVIKGWARLEISDSGVAVYHFHTLISGSEKQSAIEV